MGGYRSGKTTALRELADSLPAPLVICATEAAAAAFGPAATAKTFWRLAAEIVGRHDRPVRVLSSAEQRGRFADDNLAEAVCHYQASFLGREELRTHAHAAGVYDLWETVADAAEDYLAPDEADWASVLVRASLLLRDEAVLAAERGRFSHVLVDDFEAASFATNRLLTQLVGYGGPVVVAGNPANAVWRFVAGSPRYLERFPRRFGALDDVRLDGHWPVTSQGEGEAELVIAPGGDPWLSLPEGPVPVALASSLAWDRVRITVGCAPAASPYDLDLLAGPDVPDDAHRERRRRQEDEARWALALSRGQTVVQPPSTAST